MTKMTMIKREEKNDEKKKNDTEFDCVRKEW